MGTFLERFRNRLFERQQEAEDMREMLALLDRQMKAAQEMTADRDRLYQLIDEKGYEGAFLAIHGGIVTKPAELAAQMTRERDSWRGQYCAMLVRVAELEEAFRVYGFHHYDCEAVVGLSCTCGLTDLLEKPLSSERSAGHA